MNNARLLPITALVALAFSPSLYAQTQVQKAVEAEADTAVEHADLRQVTVQGKHRQAAHVERVNREKIDEEMIRDTRDLVRYSADVGIADNGRHLKGFAMRGVEGNRVGVSIDGVALPDSEENTLYARYGNFNPSRLSIDPELVRTIDLTKGADSFESGSGALGGNVNYRTLEAHDIVQPDNRFGTLLRSGYASKNREWAHTAGVGFTGERVEALALYSQRYGHEMKSRGEGDIVKGKASQQPDPAEHRHHSYLGKLAFQITPEQRIGVSVNGQTGQNATDERSYASYGSAWREADDRHKRFNGNLFYEYAPDAGWLSLLRADYDVQKTDLAAVNDAGTLTYDWATDSYGDKELDEIKDRRMKTRYQRLSLRADSQPFQAWGEHRLGFKAYAARRDFHNINHDRGGIGNTYEYTDTYTIQHPMRTGQYGFSLKDSITWNPTFSGQIGVRYDHEKVSPRELNAGCSKACTAEGKPAGKIFGTWNGFAGLNMQLTPAWKTGYQISTGYRTPTASEMYFTFENPYGTWKSNPDLKPERSVSHSLSLQGNGSKGTLDFSLYHSRYRDFLFEQTSLVEQTRYGRVFQTPMNQTVNLDKARISGLEFKGRLNLDTVMPVSAGWKLFGALGYSHSKLAGEASLLSTQPLKAVIGLDYEQPEGKWGMFSRLTYLGAKKPRDAKVEEVKSRCTAYTFDDWYGEEMCTRTEMYKETVTAPHLNKAAYVFDLYGFYRPSKNLTLRAGAYNLFNRKYHTWDALRGINDHSTTNGVDKEGKGLQRFYAPGRNYAVSLEYKF